MPKGYWIPHLDVSNLRGFQAYRDMADAAHKRFGSKLLARGGRREVVEGKMRARNVLREFNSYDEAQAFYRGSIAKRIAADMLVNGGLITEADLAQYRAIERKPVKAHYRGHVLFTGGPPVGSGVSLLEAFQVLANYTPGANAAPSANADYWHYLIESWKMRDRVARIADPAQWPVDPEPRVSRSTSTGDRQPSRHR